MICAIYARKSTEQNDVGSEEKSVTRQIQHGKAYAEQKGWTAPTEYVFSDDGISGVNFVSRPGFIRLMNSLKPKPPFNVLVMSEESRLGRESIETAYALKQITDAGVRVFFYLEDRERKLDSAMDKVMLSLATFGAEVEREKCRQRTHDAMRRKAERKEVIGCPVYGYDVVAEPINYENANRPRMLRRINPAESKVVLRLFAQYSTGTIGFVSLAKQLNAEGIPPPRGHKMGWAPTCIRAILRRELYRGVLVWNKTQAIVRGGRETFRKRPESEWLRIDAPELRIVPEDLWQQCHAQIQQRSEQYLRHADGRLYGHPSGADVQSRYLLVGMAQCGVCGASLGALRRGKGGGQPDYMCLIHYKRGVTACSNNLRMKQPLLDAALINGVRRILDPSVLADAVAVAIERVQAGQSDGHQDEQTVSRDLRLLEGRLARLVDAIASGRATESVYTELERMEGQKKVFQGRLAALQSFSRLNELDSQQLKRSLTARVEHIEALLGRNVPQTRQLLRKLIDGRVVCTPTEEGQGYAISAKGTYAGLLGDLGIVTNGGGGGEI